MKLGGHLPFSLIAPFYFLVERPFQSCRKQALDQTRATFEGQWIIVGAGTLPEYRLLNTGVEWQMIEPSKAMARKGKKRSQKIGLQHCWHHTRWEDYDPSEEVEGIYFPFVLGVHPRPEEALSKAWKTIRPGGTLLVVDLGLEKDAYQGLKWVYRLFTYLVSRPVWSLKAWMNQHGEAHFEPSSMGTGIWICLKVAEERRLVYPKQKG